VSAGTPTRDGEAEETTGVFSGPPKRSLADKLRDSNQITNVRNNGEDEQRGPDTQITTVGFALERGVALGEFVLQEKIGQGGMGTVYSAIHPMIAKRAAIKVLDLKLCRDRTMVERFIDEARVVNEIGHPNIVDIFAFGEMPDGRRYLAMEFLKGETLRDRLKRGRASLTEMAHVIRPLARALEATHDKNVIHRDLKPENIFLVDVPHDLPHVKLLDFGVAKLAKEKVTEEDNAILGTPMYISPEQARAASGAGPPSDVYSLGAIAFELLTGRPPFMARTAVEMVSKHIDETPVAPSSIVDEIPDEIDRLVLEMLAKAPEDRPSLGHVRAVLELVKDPSEVQVAPRSITVRASNTPATGMPQQQRVETDPGVVQVRFSAKKSDPAIAPTGEQAPVVADKAAATLIVGPAAAKPNVVMWIALAVIAVAVAAIVITVV
jgi:serine/threonine-protein kinase